MFNNTHFWPATRLTPRRLTLAKGAAASVQDVHNLAWKLAAVLRGQASSTLLATYSPEREPIGAYFAHLSGDMVDAYGLLDPAKMQEHAQMLLGLPDYTYRSPAILAADQYPTTPASALPLAGEPGTRLPHLWLDDADAHLTSTLDWYQDHFGLVVSGAAAPWQARCAELSKLLVVHELAPASRPMWQQLTNTQPGEALLVRPDGFVAARLSAMTSAADLATSLRRILCV